MALTTAKYYTPSGRLIQRDYSVSSFEYYYMNENGGDFTLDDSQREIRETDSGRTVMGGGGITPDIVEPARELERFEGILATKDVFFQYARRLTSGDVAAAGSFTEQLKKIETGESESKIPDVIPELVITEEILVDFKEYLRSRNIEFTEEDITKSAGYIKRRIKEEVYNSSFGLQEGYKVGIQGDRQVLKALEVLPEAKLLMTSGRIKPAMQNQSN
ncbi:MAG: hypothetical protein P8Y80_18325 [Acidobacteriota bacterium]